MGGIIEHDNIIYIAYISEIGGVETFAYELAKKYKDRDIAVVCKKIDKNQLIRLSKLCWVYVHTDQQIVCKTAVINCDTSIIRYINEGAKIYQTIHADYEHSFYKCQPPTHDRITGYIGITTHIVESFKRLTGRQNVFLGYNPLTIEEDKPCLTLVSATRLSAIKGKDRMIGLAKALDRAGINYLWYIFTNDTDAIDSPNVIYMKPRLDVGKWISKADYVVQLSDSEACSYTINESLYRNVPVIVTPLPYLDEIGYKDGVTGYTLRFDCSNMDDIVKKIQKIPKFKFKPLEDKYGELFTDKETLFKEDNMRVRVKCKQAYWDMELYPNPDNPNKVLPVGFEWVVEKERADYLAGKGLVEIVQIEEAPKEKPKAEEEKKISTKKAIKR